jgi:hypothetical protein
MSNDVSKDDLSMKKVQSLIKGWMEHIENYKGWTTVSPSIRHVVRRAIVRVAWGGYKIGLLTMKKPE